MIDRAQAHATVRRYVESFRPPLACGHRWSRWFGLVLRWRTCAACRMVEGSLWTTRSR